MRVSKTINKIVSEIDSLWLDKQKAAWELEREKGRGVSNHAAIQREIGMWMALDDVREIISKHYRLNKKPNLTNHFKKIGIIK